MVLVSGPRQVEAQASKSNSMIQYLSLPKLFDESFCLNRVIQAAREAQQQK